VEQRVRWEAACALGNLGGDSAVAALIAALHDPEERVRCEAVQALSQIGDPSALPALVRLGVETDETTGLPTAAALHAQSAADQIRQRTQSPPRPVARQHI